MLTFVVEEVEVVEEFTTGSEALQGVDEGFGSGVEHKILINNYTRS